LAFQRWAIVWRDQHALRSLEPEKAELRLPPYPVVLASASPRRIELLRTLVNEFKVQPADINEDPIAGEEPQATAQRLAREKALAVFEQNPDSLIIAGDTIVALGATQLAKPADQKEARKMLEMLSGKEHEVITGVALRWPKGLHAFVGVSQVQMHQLTAEQIEEYIATPEPYDKAGGYAIQGLAGKFIRNVRGSHTNVIGLPMELLEEALKEVR